MRSNPFNLPTRSLVLKLFLALILAACGGGGGGGSPHVSSSGGSGTPATGSGGGETPTAPSVGPTAGPTTGGSSGSAPSASPGSGGAGGPTSGPAPAGSSSPASLTVTGSVMGGASPISGSQVTLYRSGDTLGGSAVPLGSATTGNDGKFSVSFTDPEAFSVLYLTAAGGNAGMGANSAISLGSILGTVENLPAAPVTLNEVTSTVLAYTMRPFIEASSNQSISGSLPSLGRGASTALTLVDPVSGSVRSSLDGTAQALIDGLAGILASCVGGTASDCSTLFSAATPAGGRPPADTFSAALDILGHPSANVAALWALIGGAPQQTTVSAAPPNFSLALNIKGGALDFPTALAADSAGNIWVANRGESTSFAPFWKNSSVMKLPAGATSCSSSCTAFQVDSILFPDGIAVDQGGDVWVANTASSTVVKIPSGGDSCSSCILFKSPSLIEPAGIAVDIAGNVWVGNSSEQVTQIPAGATSCTAGCTAINEPAPLPAAVAADSLGNIWSANEGDGTSPSSVVEIQKGAPSDCSSGCINFTGGGISAARSIAIDSSGNVWVANFGNNSVTKIPSGASSCSSCINFVIDGKSQPAGIAVDSGGNVWVANFGSDSVTQIPKGATSCASACVTLTGGGLSEGAAIAVDLAGNLWVANNGNNSLTEFVGAAAPTKTPIDGAASAP